VYASFAVRLFEGCRGTYIVASAIRLALRYVSGGRANKNRLRATKNETSRASAKRVEDGEGKTAQKSRRQANNIERVRRTRKERTAKQSSQNSKHGEHQEKANEKRKRERQEQRVMDKKHARKTRAGMPLFPSLQKADPIIRYFHRSQARLLKYMREPVAQLDRASAF